MSKRRRVRGGRGVLDGAHLRLVPGVRDLEIDDEGTVLSDSFDPRALLNPNIGDTLVIGAADPADDTTAAVEVLAIDAAGVLELQLRAGEMPRGRAYVKPAWKARPAKRPAAKRKPVSMPGAPIAAMVRRARERLTPHTTMPGGTSPGHVQISEETDHGHDTAPR